MKELTLQELQSSKKLEISFDVWNEHLNLNNVNREQAEKDLYTLLRKKLTDEEIVELLPLKPNYCDKHLEYYHQCEIQAIINNGGVYKPEKEKRFQEIVTNVRLQLHNKIVNTLMTISHEIEPTSNDYNFTAEELKLHLTFDVEVFGGQIETRNIDEYDVIDNKLHIICSGEKIPFEHIDNHTLTYINDFLTKNKVEIINKFCKFAL